MVGCAVVLVPFAPSMPRANLDSSWAFGLDVAIAQGLVFGRDLVFTFGPYAFAYTHGYYAGIDGLALAATLLLAVALGWGITSLTTGWRRWLGALFVLLMCLPMLRDPLFFSMPLVFLALVGRHVGRAGSSPSTASATLLLVVALALLPLIKGTFAAAAAVGLGLGVLVVVFAGRWRWAIVMLTLFAASMAGFWLTAGQPLAALPGFFMAQRSIVSGYTEAMAFSGPPWEIAVYLAVAAGVLALNTPAAWRGGRAGLVLLAGTAVLLLLAFKAGFVRQDLHVTIAAGALGLLPAVLAMAPPPPAPPGAGRAAVVGPVLALLLGLGGSAVLGHAADGLGPRRALLRIEQTYAGAWRGLLARSIDPQAMPRAYDAALATIRAQNPLPPLSGSTDIYSTGQAALLAQGLAWSPRPVLQSYSAYNPALAALNAQHLQGPSAPQNVVITLEPIDGRLPALEDGPSWLPLLTRYQATVLQFNTAILRRLPGDPPALAAPDGPAAIHRLGEVVPVADPEPLWARIDVQPTLAGRVLALLLRPPALAIALRLANGKVHSFRYIAGMGRAGFVLSPLVRDAAGLLALQLPNLDYMADKRVVSFSIDGDARFWRRDYAAMVVPLRIPAQPAVQRLLYQRPQSEPADAASSSDALCWLDEANGAVIDRAKPLPADRLERLIGWGFADASGAGIAPTAVEVSLRGADGTMLAVPATFLARPDVGRFFHHPQLKQIGFQVLLDLQGLSGSYTLALEMTSANHHWHCPLVQQPMVVVTPPSL